MDLLISNKISDFSYYTVPVSLSNLQKNYQICKPQYYTVYSRLKLTIKKF